METLNTSITSCPVCTVSSCGVTMETINADLLRHIWCVLTFTVSVQCPDKILCSELVHNTFRLQRMDVHNKNMMGIHGTGHKVK